MFGKQEGKRYWVTEEEFWFEGKIFTNGLTDKRRNIDRKG